MNLSTSIVKKKQNQWQKKSRKSKRNKSDEHQVFPSTSNTPNTAKKPKLSHTVQSQTTIRKRAQRVRQHLPESRSGWAATFSHIIKNATPQHKSLLEHLQGNEQQSQTDDSELDQTLQINKVGRPKKEHESVKKKLAFSSKAEALWKSDKNLKRYQRRKKTQVKRISKAQQFKESWNSKINKFLQENSRIMPNKKDTLIIKGQVHPKYHLLSSKFQLYTKFKLEHPMFARKFITFLKMIPRNFKSLNLTCRRVCVCLKDYNLEQKLTTLNKLAMQKQVPDIQLSLRELSNLSICKYDYIPTRKCVDRECDSCGSDSVLKKYRPLLTEGLRDESLTYIQWEQRKESYINKAGEKKSGIHWQQVEKKATPESLVQDVAEALESFTGHQFRADYQHRVQSTIISETLPIDQCLAVFDFSQNIMLVPQDEIESANWTQKQVTLHPIYVVRHAPESTVQEPVIMKESLIIISDYLNHDANTVHVFTQQLIKHLRDYPGAEPVKTINRFSDNCATQYKSREAFSHIDSIEKAYGVNMVYHYTESGHGKGPSDGLGAAIKKRLERLILAGKVINTAYKAYLALTQTKNENLTQRILYVPTKMIKQCAPKRSVKAKTIKGTQTFHRVKQWNPGSNILVCSDLSCSCTVCLTGQEGPCYFAQYRHDDGAFNLMTGKKVSRENLVSEVDVSDASVENACSSFGDGLAVGGGLNSSDIYKALESSIVTNEQHLAANALLLSAFNSNIAEKGLKIRGNTPADGNCAFWAISDQLDRVGDTPITHTELRRKVVSYMQNMSETDRAQINNFLTTDIESYIDTIQKNGMYADHVTIHILSMVLQRNVKVVLSNGSDTVVGNNEGGMLLLGYIPDMKHYVSLGTSYEPEDFVAVCLETQRKKHLLYIAKILEVDGHDVHLKFLKHKNGNIYTWPVKEDVSWTSIKDIIMKLSHPELAPGRGLGLSFKSCELAKCLSGSNKK